MFPAQIHSFLRIALAALAVASLLQPATSAFQVPPGCTPGWQPTFGGLPGTNARIFAQTVFDDGGGPALYVAGEFTNAGGVPAQRIARWNGASWSALGSGTNGTVKSLAVFDDGSGPALFVGGEFTSAGGSPASRIAKWNGTSWSALGSGCSDTVLALVAFNDGSGPALYAGGYFATAGGVPVSGVARWNGTSWSAMGTGSSGVNALGVYNDGTGAALYAASWMLAKWNGSTWSTVGSFHGKAGWANTMAAYDDGSGPALYVGGIFTQVNSLPASGLARWDGSTWSVPGGLSPWYYYEYTALTAFDDGTGPALYAGGDLGGMGDSIERWNGSSWSTLTSSAWGGYSEVRALTGFDDGSGPALFAGGSFSSVSDVGAANLVKRSGSSWTPVGQGLSALVKSLQAFDDGTGPALYVGGGFVNAGAAGPANGIARWNGASWTPLGGGLPSGTFTSAFTVFDDGSGPALYADSFLTGGVLRWNGSGWTPLGFWYDHNVWALRGFDDGSGPALHAGGYFRNSSGAVHAVVKWNGSSWLGLGNGLTGPPSPVASALAVFDDGSGRALFAGGNFTHSGATVVNGVARWNGSVWQALGSGMTAPPGASVLALAVFDAGSGPRLYAGGYFQTAGGVAASYIASWNGAAWSPVGGGTNGTVRQLTVLDDGGGLALFASGDFTTAGGVPVNHLAKWNGVSWSAFASGLGGVIAMAEHDDGSGPALYFGGSFDTSPAGDSHLAQWDLPCPSGSPYCFGDGSGTPCPCANHSNPIDLEGCLHSFGTGGKLTATGVASLSADSVVLAGSRMPNSSALYFQGTTSANGGAGVVFGDGLQCASGTIVRLGTRTNVAGASQFPAAGDPSLSVAGLVTSPGTRYYQVWYRNPASFCTSAVFNLTNGWRTDWLP